MAQRWTKHTIRRSTRGPALTWARKDRLRRANARRRTLLACIIFACLSTCLQIASLILQAYDRPNSATMIAAYVAQGLVASSLLLPLVLSWSASFYRRKRRKSRHAADRAPAYLTQSLKVNTRSTRRVLGHLRSSKGLRKPESHKEAEQERLNLRGFLSAEASMHNPDQAKLYGRIYNAVSGEESTEPTAPYATAYRAFLVGSSGVFDVSGLRSHRPSPSYIERVEYALEGLALSAEKLAEATSQAQAG